MMNFDWFISLRLRHVLPVCFLSLTMLSACAKPNVPVNLHGVNYGAETFTYVIVDPKNPKNTGGGGLIEPYSAGGTMCCIDLPKKWHGGIKLTIESTHWQENPNDESLREVAGTHLVDVPQYADGRPGELWVLRAADGRIALVSSDFQPDHPKWPGKVKGWPVPSLVYQREQWDKHIDHQMSFVRALEELSALLNTSPDKAAEEEWAHALEYNKKSLSDYDGPNDERYREALRRGYEVGLQRTWREVKRLQEGRP
jgi:hypothetical protein